MVDELKQLLPPPGCWLFGKDAPKPDENGKFLEMFKEPEEAKIVIEKYQGSHANAVDLLGEAKLLYQNKRYARAVALGISAWEELGKSQMAADYYTGVIPEPVYKKAFTDHRAKTSYLHRTAVVKSTGKMGVVYDKQSGEALEKIRQDALYISDSSTPDKYTKEDAEFIMQRVFEHLHFIHYAEELNDRIGSKGIFK
ncbi:hypothetical protein AUJ46_01125 [Candidatus Peregrinibacteria bacterium CG1_02_54_53]|nr:MAG: hypothetical protein AUJ46_01125 [Candidatus Peregrinibacteria bacterium CG1_02_54_53]